jgi:integrase
MPSSNSSLDHRRSDAHIVENGFARSEINWEQRTLVIPAERMKTRAQHVVPLSDRVLALLEQQKQYSTSQQYVFTSRVPGQPLDEKAIRAILRYMDERCTPHGFRSTFRTWCAEETSFDFYATEMCLSHAVGSAVAQAYLRGDGISKRRPIMDQWASFCASAA